MDVWTVHVTLADEIRPTEAVFTREPEACAYATVKSRDHGILAASVTLFVPDRLGTRRTVAMFVDGIRQDVPYVSNCRNIHGGGRKH